MKKEVKIGIIGCGAIGGNLAKYIDLALKGRMRLSGIYDIDERKIESVLNILKIKPKMSSFSGVIKEADLIIEAASIEAAKKLIPEVFSGNKSLIILSVGVFIRYPAILNSMIDNYKGNIYIPSGAICGIDGLNSLRQGKIKRLILTTSKPPKSLSGVGFLQKRKIDIFSLKKETLIFKGNMKEAIKAFPQNINVAATIFLATGFKNIEVLIKVDPELERNTHRIEVEAEEARIKLQIENVPSENNPKTSYLAILSTQALLDKLSSRIVVGS